MVGIFKILFYYWVLHISFLFFKTLYEKARLFNVLFSFYIVFIFLIIVQIWKVSHWQKPYRNIRFAFKSFSGLHEKLNNIFFLLISLYQTFVQGDYFSKFFKIFQFFLQYHFIFSLKYSIISRNGISSPTNKLLGVWIQWL